MADLSDQTTIERYRDPGRFICDPARPASRLLTLPAGLDRTAMPKWLERQQVSLGVPS
jgi:hypothetical protein